MVSTIIRWFGWSYFWYFNPTRNQSDHDFSASTQVEIPQCSSGSHLRSVAWERSGSWMVGLCLRGTSFQGHPHPVEDPLIEEYESTTKMSEAGIWCFTSTYKVNQRVSWPISEWGFPELGLILVLIHFFFLQIPFIFFKKSSSRFGFSPFLDGQPMCNSTSLPSPGWRMRGLSSRKLPAKRWCTSPAPWSGPRCLRQRPETRLAGGAAGLV